MRTELMHMERVCSQGRLNSFTMSIYEGEIVALTGLSDSGVEAVADILTGKVPLDSGDLWLFERKLSGPRVEHAASLGIFQVYGIPALIPTLTLAENIFLVQPGLQKKILVNHKDQIQQTQMLFEDLNIPFSPLTRLELLRPVQQRMVELVKLAASGARLIVMEDTLGAYSNAESEKLFSLMGRLSAEGISFLLLTRRHEELAHCFDRLLIMREGQCVKCLERNEYQKNLVYRLLLGQNSIAGFSLSTASASGIAFSAENLSALNLPSLSFALQPGEILGLLDLGGSRIDALTAFFRDGTHHSGSFTLNGVPYHPCPRTEAVSLGVGMIDVDDSLIYENLSWSENIALMRHRRPGSRSPILSKQLLQMLTAEYMELLGPAGAQKPLSNSNMTPYAQIKLTYLRWLAFRPHILICVKPFANTDVLGRETITGMLQTIAQSGIGVLVLSVNPNETAACCSRTILLDG